MRTQPSLVAPPQMIQFLPPSKGDSTMRAWLQRVRFLYFGGSAPKDAKWPHAGQCFGCKKLFKITLLTQFQYEEKGQEQGFSSVPLCARCMRDMGY